MIHNTIFLFILFIIFLFDLSSTFFSMLKKCEICGKETSKLYRCNLCGRLVCSEDYNLKKGICIACEEALCQVCRKNLSTGYCKYCGRLVCEECSVRVGAEIVCKECIKKSFKANI